MNRTLSAFMVVSIGAAGVWLSAADAAPPTVTPSPGYDARLQQSRTAASGPAIDDPGVPATPPPSPRHHLKRVHPR
jgi:hypothetical protein